MNDTFFYIKSTRAYGEEVSEIEFATQGSVFCAEGKSILRYEETELIYNEKVETTIYVEGDTIVMERTGDMMANFVFERSKIYSTIYKTPFGDLDMTLLPTVVDAQVEEEEGSLELEYVLNLAGEQTLNRLKICYSNHVDCMYKN